MNLPERIKLLREKNGWTQEDLAAQCGVSPRTPANWEQGRTAVGGSALVILKGLIEKMENLEEGK